MKNRMLKNLIALTASFILIGGALLIVTGQDIKTAPNFSGDYSKRSIEGVWLVVAQRRDCVSGNPVGPAGRGLMTFATGGTMSEMTAPPAPPAPLPIPIVRGAGHGIWHRLNWENYTGSFILHRLNPDGTFVGWIRSRGSFQLMESGNELTATGSTEVLNADGDVIGTGCSTSTGTRFE